MLGAGLLSSSLRSPRIIVLSDGAALPNVLEADVLDNAHFAAGRFTIRLALDGANATNLFQSGNILDLQLTLGGQATSLIQGEADRVSLDVISKTVMVEGRDLTGRLLDSKTQETFSNQTSSEIANTLAARHGLTPNVRQTSTLAGRYYSSEHDRLTLAQFSRATTEWDLLTFLAAKEGFDVFVSGTTLNFIPQNSVQQGYLLSPAECISLRLEHALTLARDIEVTVKSWNTRQQTAFTQTARSSGRRAGSSRSGVPQRIVVVRPNLSPNDALQLAQRILADLSAHERIVIAELPGDLYLTARSVVSLTGTNTDFDQTYHVAEIDRHFSWTSGFTQRIILKNVLSSISE